MVGLARHRCYRNGMESGSPAGSSPWLSVYLMPVCSETWPGGALVSSDCCYGAGSAERMNGSGPQLGPGGGSGGGRGRRPHRDHQHGRGGRHQHQHQAQPHHHPVCNLCCGKCKAYIRECTHAIQHRRHRVRLGASHLSCSEYCTNCSLVAAIRLLNLLCTRRSGITLPAGWKVCQVWTLPLNPHSL